jgi:NADH:ubiquinone oxidoreductase subunit E
MHKNMVFLRKVKIHEQELLLLIQMRIRPLQKIQKIHRNKKPNKTELKKLEKQFLEEIHKNPDTQEIQEKNIIELLQEIQEKNKYISEEAIIKLSKEMGIPAINLIRSTNLLFTIQTKRTRKKSYMRM